MQVLPKGITGFYPLNSEIPSEVSESNFKSFCYQFTRYISAKIDSVTERSNHHNLIHLSSTRNYYAQLINYKTQSYWILCNKYYPLIGISTFYDLNPEPQFVDITLFDVPSEIPSHVKGEFVMLTSAQLKQKLSLEMLSELEPVELEEIKYWEPSQIAHIIFNTWD